MTNWLQQGTSDPGSLAELRELILPEAVSWWPLAPGWYVLVAILAVCSAILAHRARMRWRRRAYRRSALAELDRMGKNPRIESIGELLKRVAIAAYGRRAVASLSGDTWLRFLESSSATTEFTRGPGRAFAELVYAPAGERDVQTGEQIELARAWIRSHRVGD